MLATNNFIPLTDSALPFEMKHEDQLVTISIWRGGKLEVSTNKDQSTWGFISVGRALLTTKSGNFSIQEGMYFSATGEVTLSGKGEGLFITQTGQNAFFHLGGPIEEKGRLHYIDGCTDSLLVSPVIRGDACLNLLHIPSQTFQSQHTHPSLRAGIIVSGSGECITPEGSHPLYPGLAFIIPAQGQHSFKTSEEALRVIAFHPDSDFGPTHEEHPMINRTYLTHEMS
jgi:quercetin dioxygenase-like cupin family protein